MEPTMRLFEPDIYCGQCPFKAECRPLNSDIACPSEWSRFLPGGPSTSHPADFETLAEIRGLGGVSLDTSWKPLAVPKLEMPGYVPQPRFRASYRGWLKEDNYVIRLHEVLRNGQLLTAAEVRDKIGLDESKHLHLVLFDKDELLEELWSRGWDGAQDLADARYASISAPSFSTYWPRMRTEYLINVRRSQIYFAALQMAGANAIPRLAWATKNDATRFSEWANRNPTIEVFSLDLSTYNEPADWETQVEGLSTFDRLTGGTHQYLINGPSKNYRFLDLFNATSPDRVRITNATSQKRINPRRLRSTGDQAGPTFEERAQTQRVLLDNALADYRASRTWPKAA